MVLGLVRVRVCGVWLGRLISISQELKINKLIGHVLRTIFVFIIL